MTDHSHSNTPAGSQETDQHSFTRRAWMATWILAAVFGLAWGIAYVAQILLTLFVGVLLAIFLAHLAGQISYHTRLSYGWSLTLLLIALVAAVAMAGTFLGASIATQVQQLVEQLPRAAQQLHTQLDRYRWGQSVLDYLGTIRTQVTGDTQLLRRATGYASATLGALASVVVVLFIGLYVAYQPELYARGIVRLLPPNQRGRARQVLETLGTTLWHWLLGRLIAMAILWALTSLGLWLLGVPLALALGLLAGLLSFIPNIGPILSFIPAGLLAIPQGFSQVLYVAILYIAIQAVESYAITPPMQRRMVSLPPALTISVQIIMGVLFGFLGLLLATPLAAMVLVLVKMLYLEDVLGEAPESSP